jgi:hypothetical protein
MSESNGEAAYEFPEHEEDLPIKVGSRSYTVRDMTDGENSSWMTFSQRRLKTEDYTGFFAELVSKCLYDDSGQRVAKSTILGWSLKTQRKLFDLCLKHNGIDAGATEAVGKG